MTTYNTQRTTIKFRSKFEKFLNNENRSVITNAFNKFCSFNSCDAYHILWCLTYKPHDDPYYFKELGLDIEQISDEMLTVLVNELRYQYKQIDSDFCKVEVPEALLETFTAFINATNDLVAKHVYERCTRRLHDPEWIEINLSKMVNEKAFEKTRVQAIKSFAFGHLEALYLHSYRKPLHDLLEKMHELNLLPITQSCENKPFSGLEEKLSAAGYTCSNNTSDLPFEFGPIEPIDTESVDAQNNVPEKIIPVSEPVQIVEFKSLSSEEVIAHREVFESFAKKHDMNALIQISTLGFNLNEVMFKKDAIEKLLSAIEIKEKAEADLLEATEGMNS